MKWSTTVRKPFVPIVAALLVALPLVVGKAPVQASPAQLYAGPYFGDGNFPPGCVRDWHRSNPANVCHHMKTDINPLDSPQVDVLVLVPASPAAERDMRIMRQSVEMWEGGIGYLAEEMGLDWLADGMDFHVTVDYVEPAGDGGGEFTTYPIVDPEIVVVAANEGVGAGIGIDPVATASKYEDVVATLLPDAPTVTDEDMVPCHGLANPFDFGYWESLPGFDSHHEGRSGTYTEDCGGQGGNVCFAVTTTAQPAPDVTEGVLNDFFHVLSHEFGHCLSLGHVGDNPNDLYGVVPVTDIMAYTREPWRLNKCVSTLDVEGVALRMSRYLDVNGDGAVDAADRILANDQVGIDGNPVQVQHPHDHLYASATGSALDCPQPDVGLVPGERTDWTPTPVDTPKHSLTVASPADGAVTGDGRIDVTGTLERRWAIDHPTTTSWIDPTDARSAYTETLGLDVAVTETDLVATLHLAEVWSLTNAAAPASYTLYVDGNKTTSHLNTGYYLNPAGDGTPRTEFGSSSWDPEAETVTFRIPRDYLSSIGARSPYYVRSEANIGILNVPVLVDDRAPDVGYVAVADPSTVDEHVFVFVDEVLTAGQDVDTDDGSDSFAVPVDLARGTHRLRVEWVRNGEVLGTTSLTVTCALRCRR